MARIILPHTVEVVVASFGGVGTTFLLSFLKQYKKVNHFDDEDGIKHLPFPPLSLNKKVKFIYVYGNPQLAVISLFRRKYHHLQSKKLQKCVGSDASPIPLEMSLEKYASQGIDKFYFKDQFYNWYSRYLSIHPTMFIRYETLFENVHLLLEFLELPKKSIVDFPKKKQRNSVLDGIPPSTCQQLDRMYGEFARELDHLEDVEVRNRNHRPFLESPFLNISYLKACAGQASFEMKEMLRIYSPGIYAMLCKLK